MNSDRSLARDLLTSAVTSATSHSAEPESFLARRTAAESYRVVPVPLDELPGWELSDRLVHASGRFFTVEGLSIQTNFGSATKWHQPIIVQPEIGILGILAKQIDGVYHFLMQSKMEPGNSNFVQLAATVQATPSNYQRIHGGRPTPYLEYFLDHSKRRILVDRLLSEHASWYLRKRNRNMIVEVSPEEEIPLCEDYAWFTLWQLRQELTHGHRVNMNARTVLSCISYTSPARHGRETGFKCSAIQSRRLRRSEREVAEAMTWLIDQKAAYYLDARRISLRALDEWVCDSEGIRHRDGLYFQIKGFSISATSREVGTWSQPMLEPVPGNVIAFICQRRSGVLEFLVQAIVQPGAIDTIELAATIQLAPGSLRDSEYVPLVEYLGSPEAWIRLDAVQSEDGGRFYKADTRHVVIEVPEGDSVEAPANYRWVSLGLLNRLMSFGYYLNVEARSLLSCLL